MLLGGPGTKGFGSVGGTLEECIWTKYFIWTKHLKQQWTIKETCTCPDSYTEYGGVDESILSQNKYKTDVAVTKSTSSIFGYNPCPKPTW